MREIYLVTGGAGFIGSNFVRTVLGRTTHEVLVLDKLTYAGNLASLEEVKEHRRFHFKRGDIADERLVRELFRRYNPKAIVNFAAETHVDRSIDTPRNFLETNVTGTFVLLAVAREYFEELESGQQRTFRYLQVSTDEVFGSLGETGRFSEESPVVPNSPYSASKAAADHFVRAFHRTYGLPTLITNCSNNYGPFQFPEKLIPLMTLNALEGKPLPIYGDGGNVRDWLYVEDHCEGILRVLEEGKPGSQFNLGGDCEKANLEIVDTICDVLEKLEPARTNPAIRASGVNSYLALKTFVKDRPGHDRRYAIDSSKIRRELGWRPSHSFLSGIERTVRWYLDHRQWCATVQSRGYRRERLGLGDLR